MTQEALKLALEVNESMKDVLKQVNELIAENKALKEALAQTQEPVALQYPQKDIDWQREQQIKAQASTPPQRTWVGLTDEEFDDLRDNNFGVSPLISAVEAKLKERNT